MKLNFSELKLIQKALKEMFSYTRSEKEASELAIFMTKIEGEITSRKRCIYCERKFTKLDIKMTSSRPINVCIACFTSNA